MILGICAGFFANSQTKDSIGSKKLYVKANALFLPLTMLNAGLEYQLNQKTTLQGDLFISPWKSLFGNRAQLYTATIEVRHYFTKAFDKFYVGLNVGSGLFNIQKYNYFNTSEYQKGFTFFGGATVGYQFALRENLNMDLYLGAGTLQSFYKGYNEKTGQRYDNDGRKWDRSGEFLPYRGGVMISYKIK